MFGLFLDEAICDRFVYGIKSTELRDRLLTAAYSKDLTLALAIEMSLAYKVTLKSLQQFSHKTFRTHVVDKKCSARPKEATANLSYRCNGKGHKPEVCWFKDVECRECGKWGHIVRACWTHQERKSDVKLAK